MSKGSEIDDYLRSVVLLANEVIDFSRHSIVLFDTKADHFTGKWHFIEGIQEPGPRFQSPQRVGFLQSVLVSGRPRLGMPPDIATGDEALVDSLYVPLHIGSVPVGVLFFGSMDGVTYTDFDVHLARCVQEVVNAAYAEKKYRHTLLSPLEFCLLHRRHYFSAGPPIEEVLQEYLKRVIEERVFPLLPEVEAGGHVRLVEDSPVCSDNRAIRYRAFGGNIDQAAMHQAEEYSTMTNPKSIAQWIDRWSNYESDEPPDDIDPDYHEVFRASVSHVPVPLYYRGKLFGILSVDSPRARAFEPLVIRALSILGAQASPVIANAITRSSLDHERGYFRDILDAIPDEVLVVDEHAHVVLMNRAKQQHFPNAREGKLCYKEFEYGRQSTCPDCYALGSLETGRPVNQALWPCTEATGRKVSFVEISAGQIRSAKGAVRQVVEVVRDVSDREAMLQWMADVEYGLAKQFNSRAVEIDSITGWVWDRIEEGLKRMAVKRGRIYIYRSSCFYGRSVFPRDAFAGPDFSQFFLDPRKDIPSEISLRDPKLRPVRFEIDDSLSEEYSLSEKETRWNYLTCRLKSIPPECAEKLGKDKVRSWVDIPIGMTGRIFGKVSVDKGIPEQEGDCQPETAHEMSILASFGRFASVTMHAAEQYARLVVAERRAAALAFAGHLAHEFDNCKLALCMGVNYFTRRLPLFLRSLDDVPGPSTREDIVNAYHRIVSRLFNADLRPPAGLNPDQRSLATRIAKLTRGFGLRYRQDETLPFVVSGLGDELLYMLKSEPLLDEVAVLKRLFTIANLLSKLQVLEESERTLPGLEVGLFLSSTLDNSAMVPVNLKESIEGAIRIVARNTLRGEDILVRAPVPDVKILSYVESLRLVWINLLQNSIEAMPNGGSVDVSVSTNQDCAVVQFADRGQGLPEEVREMISGNPDKCREVGRPSRGLEIVIAILRAHQGSMRVISSNELGTTLEVSLPLKGAQS